MGTHLCVGTWTQWVPGRRQFSTRVWNTDVHQTVWHKSVSAPCQLGDLTATYPLAAAASSTAHQRMIQAHNLP